MGKSVQIKKHFAFVGGLNTEASPLTYPPNAWAEGDNVTPDIDGSISLRRAVDFEQSYALGTEFDDSVEQTGAFSVGEWNNVGGDGNLHFIVQQQGRIVSFYVNTGSTSVSSQIKSFSINLGSYQAQGNPEAKGRSPISVTSANGKLLIVSRDTNPLLVSYDADADDIEVEEITIQIRDFLGVDDEMAVNYEPPEAGVSQEHLYNLYNQGWSNANANVYYTAFARWPSKAQTWTLGKDSSDNFDAVLLGKQDFGTSPAPKGRFVLDVHNRDRTSVSGATITTEMEQYRPVTVAFFAGRAWYGGVRSPTIGSWVMFSQVAESDDKLGKCYQDADPTSEVVSDLVASDGGVIPIQDAGMLVKLVPFQDSMLALFDNGVWQISGGSLSGFAADSYEVKRLTACGCVSGKSVVVTDIGVFYWSDDGIYLVQVNEAGLLQVLPVSAVSIQSIYDEIPMTGKVYCSGAYLPSERTVYWLYNDASGQDGTTRRFQKNRMLVFDTRLKSFYTHTIESLDELNPYVFEGFITRTRATASSTATVVDSLSQTVVDASSNTVTATLSVDGLAFASKLKFFVVAPQSDTSFKPTVAEFNETDDAPICFRDWYRQDVEGVNYTGYLVPGYDFGDNQGGDKNMQALYVTVFMRRTETGVDADGEPINPSSCSLQGRWDWTDSSASNRWSQSQEVYRHNRGWLADVPGDFDTGEQVVVTKNKVRGRGKALQLKFTSANDKDMQILGWAITYLGNTNV